jgi:hypothetical protein
VTANPPVPPVTARTRDLVLAFKAWKADGAKPPLKYVQSFRDRYGKMRHYFRRQPGPHVPLPGAPGSKEFINAYAAALGGEPVLRIGPPRRQELYIISAGGSTRVKIGISANPKSRLQEMQTGSAFPLELVSVVPVRSAESEREAHSILAPWRCQGEWFDLGESAPIFRKCARRASTAEALFAVLREFGARPPSMPRSKIPRQDRRLKKWDDADDEITADKGAVESKRASGDCQTARSRETCPK